MSAMQARRRGILNVSSGDWDPSRLGSDLQIWLDASDTGTVILSSGRVSEWRDKSIFERHVLQSASFRRPNYTPNLLDGKHGVVFDGISNWLATPTNFPVSGDPAFSVYILYEKTNQNRGAAYGWGTIEVTRSAFGLYDNGSTLVGYVYVGDNNYKIQNVPTNQVIIEGYVKRPGIIAETSLAVRNGFDVGLQDGNSLNTPTISERPLHIGRFSDFAGLHLQGRVYEFLVVSSAQTDLGRQRVEGYLAHKWGIESQLPSDHPFRDNPP